MSSWQLDNNYKLVLDLSKVEKSDLNINQICLKAGISVQSFYNAKHGRMPKIDTLAKFLIGANELGLKIGFDDILKIDV